MTDTLVECVPNVSEGRDRGTIDALADAIRAVPAVRLLDVDAGAAANRTVFTFVGPPQAVGEAAFKLAEQCVARIDMRRHRGTHPRLGALDVCPFVPLCATTMEECVALAQEVGERIGRELDVPVYLYADAARRADRRLLAAVRAGEYEGLEARLTRPDGVPDYGPPAWRPAFGACIVGARPLLIAFNVTLATQDEAVARKMAARVREHSPNGRRLPAVRAIGWTVEEYGRAQVSMNLVDFKVTPPHVALEAVREEAAALGVRVEGSELVGLIPLDALLMAGHFYATRSSEESSSAPAASASAGDAAAASPAHAVQVLLGHAVRGLGLERHGPFDPRRRVVELAMAGDSGLG